MRTAGQPDVPEKDVQLLQRRIAWRFNVQPIFRKKHIGDATFDQNMEELSFRRLCFLRFRFSDQASSLARLQMLSHRRFAEYGLTKEAFSNRFRSWHNPPADLAILVIRDSASPSHRYSTARVSKRLS